MAVKKLQIRNKKCIEKRYAQRKNQTVAKNNLIHMPETLPRELPGFWFKINKTKKWNVKGSEKRECGGAKPTITNMIKERVPQAFKHTKNTKLSKR